MYEAADRQDLADRLMPRTGAQGGAEPSRTEQEGPIAQYGMYAGAQHAPPLPIIRLHGSDASSGPFDRSMIHDP